MARRKRRNSKKWIFRLLFVLLLGVAVAVAYLVWDGYFREGETVETKDESTVVEKLEETVKSEEDNDGAEKEPELMVVEKEEVVQYDGGNPNDAAELTGAITYAGVSGGNLMIRVNIDQYLNGGECMLLLATAGNTVYSNVAPVVDSASTSTCEGFNVPVNLLESGQYNITIKIESGGKKGVIQGVVAI